MIKLALMLSFFLVHIQANSSYKIQTFQDNKITIKTNLLKVNQDAHIMHILNENTSTIVAVATVISVNKNITTLKLLKEPYLKQKALSSVKWKMTKNDIVVFGINQSRTFIISPNFTDYKKVKKSINNNTKIIHPDHFALFLSKEGHGSPIKEDFKHFCKRYAISEFSLIQNNILTIVNCRSFKIIERRQMQQAEKKAQRPFYHRIGDIDSNWFGSGSGEIENYTNYYNRLLKEEN
jgi:hypothetical protein